MKKLCVIGEALIDFIPQTKGVRLKEVTGFQKAAGGAPANVAASVCRLGGEAKIITQLGNDAFGDFLIDTMSSYGIDVSEVSRTDDGDTALAFVSLASDGNRDFKFYRRTSADLMLRSEHVNEDTLKGCGAIHFCTVDLVDSPMKETHKKLVSYALQQDVLVSFDPNLRLSLWDDHDALKKTVHEFIPYAHILKISDEELEFITGETCIENALQQLFVGNVTYVIYTMGKDGARLYKKDGSYVEVGGRTISVIDTTGAGDSFIGAFLYCVLENNKNLQYSDEEIKAYLQFANDYAAHTTTKEGAMSALATQEELKAFVKTL